MTQTEQIQAFMAKYPAATAAVVAKALGADPDRIATHMSKMRSRGQLPRPAPGRPGRRPGTPAPLVYDANTQTLRPLGEEVPKLPPANTNGFPHKILDDAYALIPGATSGPEIEAVTKALVTLQEEFQRRAHAYAQAAEKVSRARTALLEAS